MSHENVLEHLLGDLGGISEDVLESVLDAIDSASLDLFDLSHDDLVKLLSAAVSSVAGAATTHYLARNHESLGQALRKGLATG